MSDPITPQDCSADAGGTPVPRVPLAPVASAYSWVVIGLLFVVATLNYLDRIMITTMVDPIRAEFAVSNAKIGLFTSVFLWVYAVVSPFGGFLADRFGRRGVIVASLFFWSSATCLSGFAHSYGQLLTSRILMGISEACYMPAGLAMVADYHRGRTRSLATGIHMTGSYCGTILGGLGGYLAAWFGWRMGFRAFGLFGVAYAIVLLLTLRDRPPSTSDAPSAEAVPPSKLNLLQMLRTFPANRGLRILFAVNILVGVFNWSIYGWLPTFLKERFHLDIGAAGVSATFYLQIASFAGVLLTGALADWWRKTNPRARSLVPAIAFGVAGPCLMLVGFTGFFFVAIAALIVVGVGRGGFDANQMPMIRELVDERHSATAFGVLNLISVAAGGVMVYAGGAMMDAHISLAKVFQGSGAAMLLAGLLLLGIRSARVAR